MKCSSVPLVLFLLFSFSYAFLDRSPEKLNNTQQTDEQISNEEVEFETLSVGTETTPNPILDEENLEFANEEIQSPRTVDCQCGIGPSGPVPLIIGEDTEAIEGEFPWIGALTKKRWDGKHHVVCGASLINSKFAVTAAHCISNQVMQRMELVFNVHNASHNAYKKNNESQAIIRKIKKFIVHPGWNVKTVDNDIGLIELAEPIDLTRSGVKTICLPHNYSHSAFDGMNATVAGWGYTTSSGGKNSELLKKVTVPVYSEEDCQETTIYQDKILPSMICAGYQEGGRDACTNDSGGPLTVEENGRNLLIGIVSWGHGCAKPKAPGVYTRVTLFTDWISKQLVRGESCNA